MASAPSRRAEDSHWINTVTGGQSKQLYSLFLHFSIISLHFILFWCTDKQLQGNNISLKNWLKWVLNVCSYFNTENGVEPEDKEGLNNDTIISLLFMLLIGMDLTVYLTVFLYIFIFI